MLRKHWNSVEIKLYRRWFNVASTSDTNVVSTLCNVENPTSDFASFSTSDTFLFHFDPQRWNVGWQLCGEKHQHTTSSFLFFLKNPGLKSKKTINTSYLVTVLIEMRLLIFMVFTQYGLACKYGIIFQISIHNWMQNCIF